MAGLNSTPSGERIQIGIFGRTNAGKSSVFNALLGQERAVVSELKGTTTDPVSKAMELLPLGPVMVHDTPGLDDDTAIGEKRMAKAKEILRRTDIAVVVIDGEVFDELFLEKELLEELKAQQVPHLVLVNKADRIKDPAEVQKTAAETLALKREEVLLFAASPENAAVPDRPADIPDVKALRERLAALPKPAGRKERRLVADLIEPDDTVVCVIPIDESAPKGRLILPQQQVLRDILDCGAVGMVTQVEQLAGTLARLKEPPKLVITDSQAFGAVDAVVPQEIALTSFSVLMARYKGDLAAQVEGAKRIDSLEDGARILISEGCTHHRQCNDIGSKKIPGWIEARTKKKLHYEFTNGNEFPDTLDYDLIIHCGGCTLPPKEMRHRITQAKEAGVPITNYGTLIAFLHGILDRACAPVAGR